MTYDHLIAEIVDQVLERLKEPRVTQQLIVIGNLDSSELEPLKECYMLQTLTSATKDDYSILITELSLNLLTNLALGVPSTRESQFILESLLKGKKVYLLHSGIAHHQFKQHASPNLYNLYQGYEECLTHYGIRSIQALSELLDARKEKQTPTVDATTIQVKEVDKRISFKGKKLLHESDLTKVYLQGHSAIVVDAKTIITPLANDFIRDHHLKVIYERAEV